MLRVHERVLVVAAHPDDEVLGCGGVICRHIAKGDMVSILILGEGITARDALPDAEMRTEQPRSLREAAIAAAKVMGVTNLLFESLPDNRFDSLDLLDVIKLVERVKERAQPDIVYTHHAGDLNIDHRVTHQAVVTAFRPLPGEKVKAVYAFEVSSSTEWQTLDGAQPFVPDYYVEITGFLEKKLEALACYKRELRPFPHPRSLEAVEASSRAAGVQVGVVAAERFRTLRAIQRENR